MCGIAGILNYDPQSAASGSLLAEMLGDIVHRGPDDQGTWIDGQLAMGMRRLSIIDLEGGHQPIFDESGRYGIVFNGEIYNYRELRLELQARGHQFRTQSDTEVVVHLYEEEGVECLRYLRGMFALAIWDRQARTLFVARDRLGIKPLYYALPGNSIVFGSEIKSLLRHPQIDARLDRLSLGQYLSLKYVASPRTMFEDIRSLPPGHFFVVRDGKMTISPYWDLSFVETEQGISEQEYADRLLELLRESVRLRLRSDVPFGAFLSGGIDSSLIVALMSEQLDEPVRTFTVGFDGDGSRDDELPYARQVARRFRCEAHEILVTSRDFVDQAESVIWHLDQPIADQATVATFMVARLARQHVKMVLTGEGGDELFAGYARYAGERWAPLLGMLPEFARASVRHLLPSVPGLRRQKIALHALSLRDEAQRLANWFPLFNDDMKRRIATAALQRDWDALASPFAACLARTNARQPLNRMLYVDTKYWLPDYLLLRGDKLTMAHSLEGRVPLLDHQVVEFAATLPVRMKLRGGVRKYLLKRVAKSLLPDSIINRPKQGFPIPIGKWLAGEANEMLHDLLADSTLRQRQLFEPREVQRLIVQHESGFADHAALLWGLMSVEIWLRQFADGRPARGDHRPARSDMAV